MLPPGLTSFDGETATASQERRRVAVAARELIDTFSRDVLSKFAGLNSKVDVVISLIADSVEKDALAQRIDRLEVMLFCSPVPNPTIEQVLQEAFERK